MTEYSIGFNVTIGSGAIGTVTDKVREFGCDNPIIICDKGVSDIGLLKMLTDVLEKKEINYSLYDRVVPEPTHKRVEEAADYIRACKADCILAFGGGATIDTAKGANILVNNSGKLWEMSASGLKPGLPMIAIPTTSGTGSDQSVGAMISDDETHMKHSVYAPVPDASICDPDLTKGLPKGGTANGAADAFAHAFEGYTTDSCNIYNDVFCEKVMELVCKNLPVALENGEDMVARESLMFAASVMGSSIASVGLHAGHAVGHAIGGRFGIPHGQATIVAMPQLMFLCATELPDKVRTVGKIIGANFSDDDDPMSLGIAVRERMTELIRNWGMKNLKELGVEKDSLFELVDEIMNDGLLYCAPVDMEEEEVMSILDCAYDFK